MSAKPGTPGNTQGNIWEHWRFFYDQYSCERVIDPESFPVWEAPDGSRRVQSLISSESCGAPDMAAGLWWLKPGEECETDIHPDASEIYYVVSGAGVLRLGEERFQV